MLVLSRLLPRVVPHVVPLVSARRARRVARLPLVALAGVLAYGLAAPLLAVAHELIVLGAAHLVGDVAQLCATGGAFRSLPLDPIYTCAMFFTLGDIQPHGLALSGPVGEGLHASWPALFAPSSLVASRAWASAVVEPGATVVSRWLCSVVADAMLIGLGPLAFRYARPGRGWLAVVGAIVQAHVVVTHLVDVPPELADVEAAGIPFAIAMIVSGNVQEGPRLSSSLSALPEPLRDVVLGLAMVALAYLPVALVLGAWKARHVVAGRLPRRPPGAWWSATTGFKLARLAALTAFGLSVAISPIGDLADAETRFLSASLDADPGSDEALASEPVPAAASETTSAPAADASPTAAASQNVAMTQASSPASTPVSDGPSVVAVTGSSYRYQFTVNGVPRVIRGIGYNIRYRRLPEDERIRRLDRDFARLPPAGVTTVFGWEPTEFDAVLLDAAQRHGLGVAPPFELDPDADYADPAVRQRITQDVLAWVERYRAHPALRMWAIGNEVLHKLVYPSWMPLRSDPAWEQHARDFAAFYVALIDRVRAADPNHPIVHRDAEDAYLTWLRDEMLKSGRRPWFIYGVNTYTPRLSEILAAWPSQGWDVPLLVSEFAPGGMSPADRPQGFREMWGTIRAANGCVLGGAVYAWTTDGPEEVDRVFGLVDADGEPVDGAFQAVGSFYRGVARQHETERTSPTVVRDERVWTYARAAIAAIQGGQSATLLPAEAEASVMGDVNAISLGPVADADIEIQRVRDARRVAWARDAGVIGEWWATWRPPEQASRKLTFVVQEREGGALGVRYIYYGPR